MNTDTFYDIHMHAFNLSHPYFRAFMKRFNLAVYLPLIGFASFLAMIPGVRHILLGFVNRILRRVRNLLSLMESDIGSFFLVTEDCVREGEDALLKADGLHVGDTTYRRIVLTPLMMDFGQKSIRGERDIHYGQASEKPIVEQVVDVFGAVRKYQNSKSSTELARKFKHLVPDSKRVLEIYPFLGLNTKNYDMEHLRKMLDKYFKDYAGRREDFVRNSGTFDGDIEHLGGNTFAGVKVYPPLGFDPWPHADKEREKVEYLYSYCSSKNIPITVHGSTSGFVAVSRRELKRNTSLDRWEKALAKYPSLKLNIAHFPANGRRFWMFPPAEIDRLKAMIRLVLDNRNVYVDFSNRGVKDTYYRNLRKVIDGLPEEAQRKRLEQRILFGTDFTVNLMSIDSYSEYLRIFSKTTFLTGPQKGLFCSENPERFLFSASD